ncbi:alkaline phosphatase family protein [Hyalangium versicolor]|uniref:alkaline phosphatase family protein n=1 Tax=Hyalangium versicolor TaxID=2861190 RepID=UPI001CC94906|nr:alkaline phosphatase family protein [Hyalangium versicolor]
MASKVTNVFVLMLENRAFDHMLGFSGLKGTNPVNGQQTQLNGLTGKESNTYNGVTYPVMPDADKVMPTGPGHEFLDTLRQLAGPGISYSRGGAYPPISNSGFVADYACSPSKGEGNAPGNFGEIMKCYSASQLPVLNALATEFAVCDNWYSSLPGPTWPNRFFLYAASSGGLDHSPTTEEMIEWETVSGFKFPNGSIFDALKKLPSGSGYRIYAGGDFSIVGALHGISVFDVHALSHFAKDVASQDYPWAFTFIEPNYGDILNNTYVGGTSQHPLDDITGGERLIKETYEAIRSSPHWETSLLIITWDEHGGFYDHVAPPSAIAPGDGASSKYNQYGFTFEQYGVRVPAVVVSPLIAKSTIDHRLYDHASVPATLERLFGLSPLTKRDANANDVTPLLSLPAPRSDTPVTLPNPVAADTASAERLAVNAQRGAALGEQSVNEGNLAGFLHVAAKHDLELSPPEAKPAILARVKTIQTRAQAQQYMAEVAAKIRANQALR